MRCSEARAGLEAQRNGKLEPARIRELKRHLAECQGCRAFEQERERAQAIHASEPQLAFASVSTDQIMQAIHQRARVSQQLEDIRQQQRSRISRIRPFGTVLAALTFFALSCVPLLLFAILLIQSDFAAPALAALSGIIEVLVILLQYIQEGVNLTTHNSWLLTGVSFAVVVMLGMWFHLMRPPREA